VKLLLVSDLHYALKQYDWTASVAPDFDVVVIAGDHLDIAGQLDGAVQITVILKYLRRLSALTKVLVSSVNHDLVVRDASGEKVAGWMNRVRQFGIPADGESVETGDALITICPWWDGPTSKEIVGAQLARDVSKRKGQWIWVYHAPPANSPTSWSGRQHFGDEALSGWIDQYQPDMVLAGHIHEAPFKRGGSWADRIGDTWVFNCGRQIGPTPTYIAIDTRANEAAWFSMAGAEIVRLDAPLARPFTELSAAPDWLNIRARDPTPA